jgi:murein L,D-transpeptidase YcbB/YkuD
MKNFNSTLIITAVGVLFSSFCFANNERRSSNDNLFSRDSNLLLETNYSQSLSENTPDSIKTIYTEATQNQYVLSNQFNKLQKVLKKYRTIEKNNQWKKIEIDSVNYKDLKPSDSGLVVKQIRERLFIVGDLKNDSKSPIYDEELMAGVLNYKKRYGLALNYSFTREHINQLNEPISDRIKSIKLNMERCFEIPEDLINATEYIIVNIPSYRMSYVKDGKNEFVSDVFVGSKWSKTEVFSSSMDKIVFSPYWNIPQSIVDNELKNKIAVNKNYLEENNIERNGRYFRQKPGENNSLGLVKFLFPNPYDIYMHDTPSKSVFFLEKRAFSHGCINIKDAKGLAEAILKNDTDWSNEKIEAAMKGEKETPYELKNKIPVYMAYFTAWVSDDTDEISFFEDIYDKDSKEEQSKNSNSVVMD